MNRRNFLKRASVFSLPAFLGGFEAAAFPSGLLRQLVNGESDKVLVLIDLNGGNDGLNTFVPLDSYDNLMRARPKLMVAQNKLLPMTDTIGLHPALHGIRQLYEQGKLCLVQGVAYPNQNRSHFRSADIWNTGVNADEYASTGWLGRYLDEEYPAYPDNYPNAEFTDPFAITMGRSISATCQGLHSNFSMAIIDTDDLGGLQTGVAPALPDDHYGRELGFLIETFKKTNAYATRVATAASVGASRVVYPDTTLAQQLKTVAKLISGGLQTKVYVLKLGGFDTHANQVEEGGATTGKHASLLKTLSDAVLAFQNDLAALELEKRVLGMTFSEFGRKIKSNAGLGTDHGTAAPMMVFGGCVNPGIIGHNPQIAASVSSEEGVAMQYDFKWVYGSVLRDWFEVEEEKIHALLTPDFQHIPLAGNCEGYAPGQGELQAKAYPNPFSAQLTLEVYNFEAQQIRAELYDVMGKRLHQFPTRPYSTGLHRLPLSGNHLPAGTYYLRVQAGNKVKTLRIVKA